MFQAAALRNDQIRSIFGLPKINSAPTKPVTSTEFINLKTFEKEAKDARGSGELLGSGVLSPGWESSRPGSARASSIVGSAGSGTVLQTSEGSMQEHVGSDPTKLRQIWSPQIWSPALKVPIEKSPDEISEGGHFEHSREENSIPVAEDEQQYMASVSDADMEAANRGERPQKPVSVVKSEDRTESPLKIEKLRKKSKPSSRRKKKRK